MQFILRLERWILKKILERKRQIDTNENIINY